MPDFKNTVGGRFLTMLEAQAPANFAMVMSTGIVSVALHLLDYPIGARLLFWLNAALCVGLAILYIIRLFVFPKRFVQDFRSHGAGPGFLTVVAGICILGNQFVLLGKDPAMGEALFWIGSVLWIVILWGVFYFVFSDEPKPPLEKGINGAWLVATVSTQAIVILGCILIDHMPWDKEIAFFAFTALFLLGFMLYLFVITMIFYRFAFKELEPAQLSPTYWINAGAVAITTLAGAELLSHPGASPLLMEFFPFIKGLTLMAWATATFWIPMLFLLGFWRHSVKQYPAAYTPEYWGMVPIGDVRRMCGHAGEVSESGIPVAVAGSLRVRGAGGVDGGFLWYGHHKAGNAPEGGLPDGIAPMGRRRTRRWSSLFHKKRMLIRNFNM